MKITFCDDFSVRFSVTIKFCKAVAKPIKQMIIGTLITGPFDRVFVILLADNSCLVTFTS